MDKRTNVWGTAKSRPGDRLGFVGHVLARQERFLGRFFGQTDNPERKPVEVDDVIFEISKPMPVELMEKQCSLGLSCLKQERIEGMVFLGSPVVDLKLEAVEWTRKWIAEVGNEPL